MNIEQKIWDIIYNDKKISIEEFKQIICDLKDVYFNRMYNGKNGIEDTLFNKAQAKAFQIVIDLLAQVEVKESNKE